MQKIANFFAHIARVLLHIIALFVVCRNLWPDHLMSTPLGKLTFGELLSGLASLGGMLLLAGVLVYNLFNPERPEDREPEWAGHWMIPLAALVALVAFAGFYQPTQPAARWIHTVHGVAVAIVIWLVSS